MASTIKVVAAGALFGLIGVMAARAEEKSLAQHLAHGQDLSQKLCAGCHLVGAGPQASAPVGPPPFTAIANAPAQTAERIRAALIKPHVPMPDMQMSNEEIFDILVCLQSLRSEKAGAPLVPLDEKGLPKLPAPT